ncbi:hypothetical protein C8T65DRAFT_745542 [Cerioporus squamosus]|nr:hypothetical protein C8T65DRAFT_745542 [Cerioporus squamosus]
MTTNVVTHVRDEEFYETLVVFKVDAVAFRISRKVMEQGSPAFCRTYFPPNGAGTLLGSDDEPIQLQGVSAQEFREFLRVIHANLVVTDRLKHGLRDVTSDWIAVLKLATLWEFSTVRTQAIRFLALLDPIERITLAQRYCVGEWVAEALWDISYRTVPLELAECNRLGLEWTVGAVKLRELVLRNGRKHVSHRSWEWRNLVKEAFGGDVPALTFTFP